MKIEIIRFKESDIDTVYAIQQMAYKPLYEKYHDDGSNPYMESKETVLRKYMRARLVICSFWMARPSERSGSISMMQTKAGESLP